MPLLAFWLLLASPDLVAADRLYAQGQFAEASRIYRQLLQESPQDPKLLVRLGSTQYNLSEFREAESLFRKAASIAPDFEPAEVGLGASLLALNHSREAIPSLEKAVKLAPTDRMALRALGHAYQRENAFFKGLPILKSLVAADPKDAESWFYLGALYYDNNDYLLALKALNSALELQPANARARIYKAGALAQLGRTQEAGDLYRALAGRPPTASSSELWLGYAQFLFESEQSKPALDAISRAITLLPGSAKLYFWKARILRSLGDLAGAQADAQKSVQLAPELPNARNLLMKICRARGQTQAADEQAKWLADHDAR
jgi:tetratricopeptide (TPR) repeat protein